MFGTDLRYLYGDVVHCDVMHGDVMVSRQAACQFSFVYGGEF
jgi:hypothetical protein